jgi:hypothetical protein
MRGPAFAPDGNIAAGEVPDRFGWEKTRSRISRGFLLGGNLLIIQKKKGKQGYFQ